MAYKTFNPLDIPLPMRHQYIIGAVAPRPICWASTIDAEGRPNLAPYSFFNAFSANPPLLIFSSNRRGRNNSTKHTLHNIEATRQVVINVVPYRLVHQMTVSSTEYPAGVNEFEKAGVTAIPSTVVKPPRVKESPVQFECQVRHILQFEEVGGAPNLFVCEIVQIHLDTSILDKEEYIDPKKIDLVGRMGRNYYCRTNGDPVFEVDNPFPKHNIGFDKLPAHIKNSDILTGNELGLLAMQAELPTKERMEKAKQHRVVQQISAQKDKKQIQSELHTFAKKLLNEGAIEEAFAVLMSE